MFWAQRKLNMTAAKREITNTFFFLLKSANIKKKKG